jgi:hypothetical protein
MKVRKPRFETSGKVKCDDCPLDEEKTPALSGTGVCYSWRGNDGKTCPTKSTYQEA